MASPLPVSQHTGFRRITLDRQYKFNLIISLSPSIQIMEQYASLPAPAHHLPRGHALRLDQPGGAQRRAHAAGGLDHDPHARGSAGFCPLHAHAGQAHPHPRGAFLSRGMRGYSRPGRAHRAHAQPDQHPAIGKLKIASHPAASSVFLPRLLTRFLQDRDDLDLSLIMRSSDVIEDLIASQQYDVGFAETPIPRASIAQVDYDLECVCVLRAYDPLARVPVITPADLDGRPMAVLFDAHNTALQTEAAFRAAGCHFNKRLELRTFLPGLQFVAAGACTMVCDMITAYSHLLQAPTGHALAIRRFRPRISNSVSILTPGFATQSLAARAFITDLQIAVDEAGRAVEAALNDT